MSQYSFNRRRILAGAAIGLTASILPARGQQKVALKLGHQYPIDHPVSLGAARAAELVKEKSGGRVEIVIFPAGQLGTGKELDQQVSDGGLDFSIDGPGIIGNWHRPVSIFESPFLCDGFPTLVKMMDGPWSQAQFKLLAEKQNMQRVGKPWYYGARHFTTRDRALKTAADAKGLKLRVPEVPLYLDMIRAIAAVPTPMALAEVYLSLQTGVVDGQENPLPTINSQKFFEVQKFVNLTAHIVTPQIIVASARRWASLAEADRTLVVDALNAGGEVNDKILIELESSLIGLFKSKGVTIVEPDRGSFQAAMKPVYEKNEAIWGKGAFAELQKLG
jgi:tripartite ATP-independent transporter DctP family solute receptor